MKKLIILLISFMITASGLKGDDLGGAPGSFLRLGLGARASALGQSFTAKAEDGYAFYYNPGALINTRNRVVSSGYQILALNRKIFNASAAINIRNDASLGLAWIHSGDDNLEGYNIDGEPTGHLDNSNNAIYLTFAKNVKGDMGGIGLNFKYVQGKLLEVNTYSVGFDVGVYADLLEKRLKLGASWSNIGIKYSWDSGEYYNQGGTYSEEFPNHIRVGAAYTPKQFPGFVEVDLEKCDDLDFRYHLGMEFWVVKQLGFRAGLNNGNATFGIGLKQRFELLTLKLDYAFLLSPYEGLPATHCLDLGTEF
ncbi:PorV/PorQ family protein [bacterium]|nr:PorV/PorQ family protein [bacterium]